MSIINTEPGPVDNIVEKFSVHNGICEIDRYGTVTLTPWMDSKYPTAVTLSPTDVAELLLSACERDAARAFLALAHVVAFGHVIGDNTTDPF